MNIETAAMVTKGFCLMSGAMAAAIAAGIVAVDVQQVAGVSVKVLAVFLGAYGVGCNSMVAFLSQSFSDWKAQRGTSPLTPPAKTP
jgi:hypothetical protein